jgi:hypothetical protein
MCSLQYGNILIRIQKYHCFFNKKNIGKITYKHKCKYVAPYPAFHQTFKIGQAPINIKTLKTKNKK